MSWNNKEEIETTRSMVQHAARYNTQHGTTRSTVQYAARYNMQHGTTRSTVQQ
jgi:hypothetical protein